MADLDRVADYRVKIGMGGGIGGRFTIGVSTIGGLDIISNQWTEFFNGPDDDVTDYIDGDVSIVRGWDGLLASLQSGRLSFTLEDPPGSIGYFDPNDSSSPLFTDDPGLDAMRPVVVQASTDGWVTTKGLCYAFIRDADYDTDPASPGYATCKIQAEDLLLWLQRVKNPEIALATGITSSQAVGLILDSFGFTDPAFRALSSTPALTSIDFEADGTTSALDLLRGILDTEQGRAYVDGNGVFHFEDRYARDRRRTASSVFAGELTAISSRVRADDIKNRVFVTKTGGTTGVAEDLASEQTYGIGDGPSITTDYLPSDASAAALAELILKRIKDPHPPQRCTIDNESLAMIQTQLVLELQNRVTISGVDCFVERIEHVIRGGGNDHTTTLLVAAAPSKTAFLIGYSLLLASGADGDYIAA